MQLQASAVVAALCIALAGCGAPQEKIETATLTVLASGKPSAADLARAQEIITLRLTEFLPGRASSLDSRIVGKTIRFAFYGAPVHEETAVKLATTQGKFTIALTNMASDVWVTEADIEKAELFTAEYGDALRVRFTESAGTRLLEKTSSHLGREMRIAWDGKALEVSKIESPFGKGVQFYAPKRPEGLWLRVMLEHGRLPIVVKTAEYHAMPEVADGDAAGS
jgi:preprotein translocase subunit SecD